MCKHTSLPSICAQTSMFYHVPPYCKIIEKKEHLHLFKTVSSISHHIHTIISKPKHHPSPPKNKQLHISNTIVTINHIFIYSNASYPHTRTSTRTRSHIPTTCIHSTSHVSLLNQSSIVTRSSIYVSL